MNSGQERIGPRWLRGDGPDSPQAPSAAESLVLDEVLKAIRAVRHGTVVLALQDGRVVQIDLTEKRRL